MAATYLWNWTGRKYGLCEVNLRPCRQDCWEGQSTFWGGTGSLRSTPYYPVIIRGAWTNISCGKCGDGCSCDGTPALRLPGPIDSRSEEHTSELQSLMRISYAVFCLNK